MDIYFASSLIQIENITNYCCIIPDVPFVNFGLLLMCNNDHYNNLSDMQNVSRMTK